MEFIEGMIQDGSMPPYTTIAENEALALFESGKVAMCMFGSWQSDLFSNEYVKEKGDRFVGFANYMKMFSDSRVWQSLLNTFVYAILEVPISILISLVLAALLNRKMKGRSMYRTIYFLPMVAAPAAVAMVWRWLYNSEFGLLNHMLKAIGLGPVNWISDPNIARISVAIVGIWSVIGYNMVLFLAGLQEIPGDYYEAAEIDGAGPVRQFLSITIPLISPTMFFVTTTRVIAAMQVFDVIYMMIDRSNRRR